METSEAFPAENYSFLPGCPPSTIMVTICVVHIEQGITHSVARSPSPYLSEEQHSS